MHIKLGEEHQALMFSVCVHGEPASHGGKKCPGGVDSDGFPAEVWCLA